MFLTAPRRCSLFFIFFIFHSREKETKKESKKKNPKKNEKKNPKKNSKKNLRIVDSQLSQWTQAAALAFSLIAPDALALVASRFSSDSSLEAADAAIDACLWLCLAFLGAVSVLGGCCRRRGAAGSTWLEVVLQLASSAAVA